MDEGNKQKFSYKGCIHIHSVNSDGTGTIKEISVAAKKAGLSWVIITDHNYFDIEEGIYNGVYILKGEEISPQKENHYLALDIKTQIDEGDNVQKYIDEVNNQGGFGFAAHPDESLSRKNNYPPIRWNKEFIPYGIEIWNWFSCWADKLNDRNIFSLAYSFLFKNYLVKKAPIETLKWWDELNRQKEEIVPAIGGVDAHALKIKKYIFPVTIFPYKTMFKTISNVIFLDKRLSNDFQMAKTQILSAIKNANNIIINLSVSNCIPEIYVENEARIAYSGEKIKLDDKTFLNVRMKKKGIIKVTFNGDKLYEVFAPKCNLLLNKKGKYRVEVFIDKKAFAYSNPIVVA